MYRKTLVTLLLLPLFETIEDLFKKFPNIYQEKKEKKRFKFKPYKGRLGSSHVSRMSESLEETEMKMIAAEIEASLEFKQMDKASGLLNMPASCHSILKVSIFGIFSFRGPSLLSTI